MAEVNDPRSQRGGCLKKPAALLLEYSDALKAAAGLGPALDLAGGGGRNGIFLARLGMEVVLVDRSAEALAEAGTAAREAGVQIRLLRMDLESGGEDPLAGMCFGAIIVFRYLHRPLILSIRRSLVPGGLLVYETFTLDQAAIGKPQNPDFLLKRGELLGWFRDWEVLHWFEGLRGRPERAVAQIVCRKPPLRQPL